MTVITRSASGSFPIDPSGNVLAIQGPIPSSASSAWDPGATRQSSVQVAPAVTEAWSIIGWSVRLRVVCFAIGTVGSAYGVLGDLWAGLLTASAAVDSGGFRDVGVRGAPSYVALPGGAAFPQDMSTFDQIFTGAEQSLPLAVPQTAGTLIMAVAQPGVIGHTFTLPQSIEIVAGQQLQMALILTPSILGSLFLAGQCGVVVLSCDYTIMYQSSRRDFSGA